MATVVLVASCHLYPCGLLTGNHLTLGGLLVVLAMAGLSLSGKYNALSNRLDDFVSQDVNEIDSVMRPTNDLEGKP